MVREWLEMSDRNRCFKGAVIVVLSDTFHHGVFFINFLDDLIEGWITWRTCYPKLNEPQKPQLHIVYSWRYELAIYTAEESPFLKVSLRWLSFVSHLKWILEVKFLSWSFIYWSRPLALFRPCMLVLG